MTGSASRDRPRVGVAISKAVLVVAALLVTVTACGSAKDLAEPAPPGPPTSPSSTAPPSAASPTPTPGPAVTAPDAGDCRSLEPRDLVTRVTTTAAGPVTCAAKHNSQTYAVRSLKGGLREAVTQGSEDRVFQAARGFCDRRLRRWLGAGASTVERSQFAFVVGVPSGADVAAGADWVRCDVYLRNGLSNALELPRSTKGALNGPKSDDYHSCVRGKIAAASGTVPCYKRHRWRSVSSVELGGPAKNYPGTGKVRGIVEQECGRDVRDYLDTRDSFRYGYILPTRATWKRGERYGVCFARTRK